MSKTGYLQPGDRPEFIEGWVDLARSPAELDVPYFVTQSLCRLLDLSRQSVENVAHSYRGFRVGTAVLAHDTQGGRLGIHFGGNFTPYKGAEWNCAEKRAFEVIPQRGYDKVLAIAVSGPPYKDSESGIESPTCQPCHRCRCLLQTSTMVGADTLVASTNLSEDVFELSTVESLLKLHETGQQQPFPVYHPLLPYYWRQIVTYNAEDERAEIEGLTSIADQLRYKV